jgi:uncharacterized protein (TIGR02145 family)
MKKLIIIAIFLMSGIWSQAQVTRPPVKTDEIQLETHFIWGGDEIWKDTLNYIKQISPTCYMLRHLDVPIWSGPYCWDAPGSDSLQVEWMNKFVEPGDTITNPPVPDSVFFTPLQIWIINGGTITINDSVFYVRIDPNCQMCWQKSYGGVNWTRFFCMNVATGRFLIGDTADSIFYMTYSGVSDNWTDIFQIRINLSDSDKVLTVCSDSVIRWKALPIHISDSIYVTNTGKKYGNNDTLTININDPDSSITNELDTIYVNSVPLGNGDSIVIDTNDADYDPTNEIDSFMVVPDTAYISKNDTLNIFWKNTTNGIYYAPSGNNRVGIGLIPNTSYQLAVYHASSNTGGIVTTGSTGYGIRSTTENGTYSGYFTGGSGDGVGGIWTSGFNLNGLVFPRVDGTNKQVLMTNGDSIASWANVDTSNTNELDLITVNDVKLGNNDSITIIESQWVDKTYEGDTVGIEYDLVVGIGTFPSAGKLTVDTENDFKPAIWANQDGDGNIITANFENTPVFEVLNTGGMVSAGLTYPIVDGDSLDVLVTDSHGNLFLTTLVLDTLLWELDTYGIQSKTDHVGIGIASEDISSLKINANDNDLGIVGYSENNTTGYFSKTTTSAAGASNKAAIEGHVYGGYNSPCLILDQQGNGNLITAYPDSIDVLGRAYLVEVNTDSLSVGTGAKIGRLGTMATYDFWTGTQAEYDAIGSPDANTIYFIHNGYGIFWLILLLFLAIGSKAQNWTAVKIGGDDIQLIMQGTDTLWVKPSSCSGVTIAGECYDTVRIGSQTWLHRNLHYDDGGGEIYSYNDEPDSSDIYGYLYSWAAAKRIDSLIDGWHLPSKLELDNLVTYLGGVTTAGGKIKEIGYRYWLPPNTNASNSSGLTLYGAGLLYFPNMMYANNRKTSFLWTSAIYNINYVYTLVVNSNSGTVTIDPYYYTEYAISIRLIKD